MSLVTATIVLLTSFYLLAKICDGYFVNSLERIAARFDMPTDIAGATLMAVGSSAPEFFISLFAVTKALTAGSSQPRADIDPGLFGLGAGTIVGSALFNLLVITGASVVVRPAKLTWQPMVRDLLFYSVSVGLLLWTLSDGRITTAEAAFLTGFYLLYLASLRPWKRLFPYADHSGGFQPAVEADNPPDTESMGIVDRLLKHLMPRMTGPNPWVWTTFCVSVGIVAALSYVLVEAGIAIAVALDLPEVIIGLTVLAVGTSVPDLVSSVVVARRGHSDMAVTNAVGSNIFDIQIGLGLPWLLICLWGGKDLVVQHTALQTDVVLLFASVGIVLVLLIVCRWYLGRAAGWLLVLAYVGYIVAACTGVVPHG